MVGVVVMVGVEVLVGADVIVGELVELGNGVKVAGTGDGDGVLVAVGVNCTGEHALSKSSVMIRLTADVVRINPFYHIRFLNSGITDFGLPPAARGSHAAGCSRAFPRHRPAQTTADCRKVHRVRWFRSHIPRAGQR